MDYQLHGVWILLYTFMKEIQLLCQNRNIYNILQIITFDSI